MTTRNLEIANTILSQLPRTAGPMMGMKNILAIESGVQFKIGGGANKRINCIKIVLDPNDTYTVEFWKIPRNILASDPKKVSSDSGVYADMLQDIIESAAGFYLSM